MNISALFGRLNLSKLSKRQRQIAVAASLIVAIVGYCALYKNEVNLGVLPDREDEFAVLSTLREWIQEHPNEQHIIITWRDNSGTPFQITYHRPTSSLHYDYGIPRRPQYYWVVNSNFPFFHRGQVFGSHDNKPTNTTCDTSDAEILKIVGKMEAKKQAGSLTGGVYMFIGNVPACRGFF